MTVRQQFSSMFDGIREIANNFKNGSEFKFSSEDFMSNLDFDVAALERYRTSVMNAEDPTIALQELLRSASAATYDYASSIDDVSAISLENFRTSQIQAEVAQQAANKKLAAARPLISEYATGLHQCGLTAEQFTDAIAQTNPQLANYLRNTDQSTVSMKGYVAQLVKTRLGMLATEVAATAMNAAISMGISLLIQLAVKGISLGWEKLQFALSSTTVRLEKFNEELQTSISAVQDAKKNFDDLSVSANKIIPRFVELAKGVDKFGENVSLADDEYAEFKDLNNQIAELFPEVKIGMDTNGDAMLNLSYTADNLAESLWNIVEAQRALASQKIADELPNQVENAKKQEKDLEKENKRNQKNIDLASKALANNGVYSAWGWDDKALADSFRETTGKEWSRVLAQATWADYDSETRASAKALIESYITGLENEINNNGKKIEETWAKVGNSAITGMQVSSTYQDLDESLQKVALRVANTLNENADISKENISEFIEQNILTPFKDAEPEVQQALVDMFNLDAEAVKGNIDAGTFQALKDEYVGVLYKSGLSDEVIRAIKLNIDTNDFSEKIAKVKRMFKNEYIDEVDKMSYQQIQIAYGIEAEDWSLTLDEFNQKISEVKQRAAEMVEVDGAGKIMGELTDATSGLQDIVSAMQTLQEGTALTTSEVVTLANTYPKLLEQANIFTDGTIDSQSKMLQYLLDSYETEYDALIDTKIAELRATNECLSQQADLERQKLEIVTEIQGQQITNNLADQKWLTEKIAELNNLQAQNYVTFENGVLKVNEEALNQKIANEQTAASDISDAWQTTSNEIAGFTNAAAKATADSTDDASKTVTKRVKLTAENVWKVVKEIGSRIAYAFTHPFEKGVWGDIVDLSSILETAWKDAATSSASINTHNIEDYYKRTTRKTFQSINSAGIDPDAIITIDDKALDDWAAEQEEKINQRIEDIQAKFSDNEILIANLEDLKGLDLKSIVAPKTTSSSGKTTSADKSSSDSSSAEDALEELDLIAIAIKRAQEATEKLQKVFSSTYITLEKRAAAFKNTLTSLTNEMSVQNAAAEAYKSAADAIAISDDLKAKIQTGSLEVAQLDKDTATLAKNYQDLYEKYLSCIDAAAELRDEIASLYEENFANIQKDYENRLSMIEHRANTIQNQMENVQTNGYILTRDYYDQLLEIEYERIRALQKEREESQRALDLAVKSGEIEEYSDSWYSMATTVNELDEAIQQCEITINSFYGEIGKLADEAFDRAIGKFDSLIDETNFLIDLMAEDGHLTDKDTGKLTPAGNATIGLHNYNYSAYLAEANKLRGEVERLNQLVAENPTNIELIERRDELLEKQRESILAAQKEKSAIKQLVEDGLKSESEQLKKNIKDYTDYLDELKDIHDYQKTMNDDNEKIANLRKQIIAYENDTSDESKARMQKLRKDLEDAVEKRNDDEFNRTISEQKKMLSQLQEDFDEQINSRLDNIDSYLANADLNLSDISSILWGISSDIASLVSISDPITSGTIPHYASGGMNYHTGLAWLDGTSTHPESVLNAQDTSNLLALRDTLREIPHQTISSDMANIFRGIAVNHSLPSFSSLGSISSSHGRMGDTTANYQVSIAIDHVENYDDFVAQMKKDGKFEKMIQSMTIGRAAGRGALDKYKY